MLTRIGSVEALSVFSLFIPFGYLNGQRHQTLIGRRRSMRRATMCLGWRVRSYRRSFRQPLMSTFSDTAFIPFGIVKSGSATIGTVARLFAGRRLRLFRTRRFPALLLINFPEAAAEVFGEERRHGRDGCAGGGNL